MKYCHLINIYAFNLMNLVLIDRVKGAHVLMNCVIRYCKVYDDDSEHPKAKPSKPEAPPDFLSKIFYTIAICLRYKKALIPFLKDNK